MYELLETALKTADEAEVFSIESASTDVSFRDGALYDISSSITSGYDCFCFSISTLARINAPTPLWSFVTIFSLM